MTMPNEVTISELSSKSMAIAHVPVTQAQINSGDLTQAEFLEAAFRSAIAAFEASGYGAVESLIAPQESADLLRAVAESMAITVESVNFLAHTFTLCGSFANGTAWGIVALPELVK